MVSKNTPAPSAVEDIKKGSNFLRGTLAESLSDPVTGAIADDDTQLSKFHGIYQQDDRELRAERRKQRLEPAYSFMIRIRAPGGIIACNQWVTLDQLASTHANDTLRLTTRQAVQFHGVIKRRLKDTVARINATLLDTLAACGDVNRNVMCSPNPEISPVHREANDWASRISAHLTPATIAYHEIWLDGKKMADDHVDCEPIYGPTYLPRKFKIAIAIPPRNDTDVFAQDLGFIAIVENAALLGFNVVAGGGMGMTHGETDTYPRAGDVIGFCTPEQVVAVAENVVKIQRDHGDRANRKHARLKYTIDDRGLEWFRDELNRRLGTPLAEARPYAFGTRGDRYGWVSTDAGDWHYTVFVENGRISDLGPRRLRSGLRAIAETETVEFRVSANQNLIIAGISETSRPGIDALLTEYGITNQTLSGLRRHSMACVALPTCGLAMAEGERYLPGLIDRLDLLLEQHGLRDDPIVIRMTGCPNGCARPYLGEIGLVGKAPGRYNLYLGASFEGQRLNRLFEENIDEERIVSILDTTLARYAAEREAGERFGDYTVRAGLVKASYKGSEFHD